MDSMMKENSAATESIGKAIKKPSKPEEAIEYKTFCREVMKMAKRNVDACFMAPLKLYHSQKKIQSMDMIQKIKAGLDQFSGMSSSDCIYFWLWLDYGIESIGELSDRDWAEHIKQNFSKIIADAKSLIEDASKPEKSKYIKELCKKREETECWILNVYELTLRKLYDVSGMRLLTENIIRYLEGYRIGIRTTISIVVNKNEEHIYKIAANLMLLVMRLRLGINRDEAVRWYNEGNSAYFNDRDQMLEEYILITGKYSYQSYERFVKLGDMAINGKNKYAAKEVGDVYRLGATLVDCHENRIFIEEDKEKARDYYYICVEEKYIPAYISLVKMEILINEKQKEGLVQQAKENRDLEGLAYYAEHCLKRADEYCSTDRKKALEKLSDAAEAIAALEDTCAVKHMLKSELLLSKTFETVGRSGERENENLAKTLQKLYSPGILKADKEALYREIEEIYVLAQELGDYEAEYRLGKLFRDMDDGKSEKYFEQGREKGCKWCMLEGSRTLKTENAKEWLNVMIKLDKSVQGNEILQECIARELVEAKEVWEAVKNKQIELKGYEAAEIYLLIYRNLINVNSKKETDVLRIEKNVKLQGELVSIMGLFKSWREEKEKGK